MLDGCVPWPSEFAHRYRARGYWAGTTLGQAFDRAAGAHAGRVAVVDGERRLTYRELSGLVNRLAVHLALRGVRGGARAMVQLPSTIEFVVAYLACLKVGAIPVICPQSQKPEALRDIARRTEAAAWFTVDETPHEDDVAMVAELSAELPGVREIYVVGGCAPRGTTRLADLLDDPVETRTSPGSLGRLRPRPEDVAVFQLSCGTTLTPNVIPRTHADYLYASRRAARVTGLDERTVLLASAPVAHHLALACPGLQGALLLGARVVLVPSATPETLLGLVEAERVTWVFTEAEPLVCWLDDPSLPRRHLGSLSRVYVDGARLTAAQVRVAREAIGPIVHQIYGVPEGFVCATRADDLPEVTLQTQGRPLSPDDEIRIISEDGVEVRPGEPGELLCRGPTTIRGYYRAPEHNRVAFTAEGFLRSGDRVHLHPTGSLVVEAQRR